MGSHFGRAAMRWDNERTADRNVSVTRFMKGSVLGRSLDCPRNRIELVRGNTSRHKVLKLHGISLELAWSKLAGR